MGRNFARTEAEQSFTGVGMKAFVPAQAKVLDIGSITLNGL